MWRNGFVTGSVPRNWKWKMKKTPKEWWIDYLETNPEYDPRNLDFQEGTLIYGSQFQNFEEACSRETDLSDQDGDDEHYSSLFSSFFMDNHFGESFKYILVVDGFPKSESLFQDNDPTVEEPQTYLHFCRLSRLIEYGWSDKKVIKEIMKFIDKYGPPWYAEWMKLHTPPFLHPPDSPLTLDSILWESQKMASAVKAYQLLSELNDDVTAMKHLEEHMAEVKDRQGFYYYLERDDSGYTIPHIWLSDWLDDTHRINIKTNVTQAAIALVILSIDLGFSNANLKLGLTNRLEKYDSIMGNWVPRYEFRSLLGAMWLQFYLQVLNKGRLRECANENCRRLFPVSRTDKEYCSKACGVKQYMRDHHNKGKELEDERSHSKEIQE